MLFCFALLVVSFRFQKQCSSEWIIFVSEFFAGVAMLLKVVNVDIAPMNGISSATPENSLITINVSGMKFQTFRSTLARSEVCFFFAP